MCIVTYTHTYTYIHTCSHMLRPAWFMRGTAIRSLASTSGDSTSKCPVPLNQAMCGGTKTHAQFRAFSIIAGYSVLRVVFAHQGGVPVLISEGP